MPDKECVVFVLFSEDLDELPAYKIAQSPGQEDEGIVSLVLACDPTEVKDDRPNASDNRAIEDVDKGIYKKVQVFGLHYKMLSTIDLHYKTIQFKKHHHLVKYQNFKV